MSWPAAPWQTPVTATPEMLGVGSYTPEQWAAMQQQNWQQWTQWQQQYSQWQTQYGTKYAEQVKAMQDGTQPPLPPPDSSAGACPPPPPDKPPPPPHENNEPLFGAAQTTMTPAVIVAPPTPVTSLGPTSALASFPPHTAQQYYQAQVPADPSQAAAAPWAYGAAAPWGYNTAQYYQNTSYPPPNNNLNVNQQKNIRQDSDSRKPPQQQNPNQMENLVAQKEKPNQTTQPAANVNEKLVDKSQKLSEEEKQFDIQFKKWEEEFENWKKANVNHPDKDAYREYEKKFETCRVQLVERREQMKIKRIAAAGGAPNDDIPAENVKLTNSTEKITEDTMDLQNKSEHDLERQDNRNMRSTMPGDQWHQDGNIMPRTQWHQDVSNVTGNQRQQGGNNMPRDQWYQDNNMQGNQWHQEGNNMLGNNLAGNNMQGHSMPGNIVPGNNMRGNNMSGHNMSGNNMSGNNLPGNNMPGNNIQGNNVARDQWRQSGNMMPVNNMGRDNMGRQDGNNIRNNNMRQDQWHRDGNNIPGNKMGRDQWNQDGKNMLGNNMGHDQWNQDGKNMPGYNLRQDQWRKDANIAPDHRMQDQKQKDHVNDFNTACDDEYQEDPFAHENDLIDSDDKMKFMSRSDPKKGIPGLDLVDKDDRLPDLDDRYPSSDLNKDPVVRKLQNFTDISKGIDNILGDEKILNILSMVSKGQKPPSSEQWGRNPGSSILVGGTLPLPNNSNRQIGDISFSNKQKGDFCNPNWQIGDNAGPNRKKGDFGNSNWQMGDNPGPNRQTDDVDSPNRQITNIGGPNRQIGNIGGPKGEIGDIGGLNRQMGIIGGPNRPIGDLSGLHRQMADFDGPNRQMGNMSAPNKQMCNLGLNFNKNSRFDHPKPLMDHRMPNMEPGNVQQSDRFDQQKPKPLMDQIIPNKPNYQQNPMPNLNERGPQNRLDMPQPRNMDSNFNPSSMGRLGYEDSITREVIEPSYDDICDLPPSMVSQPSLEPPQAKGWVNEPIMEPTVVVDYNHKPLRVKSGDFLEPVHTFDYNHISRNRELIPGDRLTELEIYSHKSGATVIDYQNKSLNIQDEIKSSIVDAQDSFIEREVTPRLIYPRPGPLTDRSRDLGDRRYREHSKEYRERSRERIRERSRERRRGDSRERDRDRRDRRTRRPRSRERQRTRSRSNDRLPKRTGVPSHLRRLNARAVNYNKALNISRTILNAPGRTNRAEKIVIILRGLPGSGKSYVAKLIAEREAANGGVKPSIFSIDDYFTTEMEITEPDPSTGLNAQRLIKQYNYDSSEEHAFHGMLLGAVRKAMDEGLQTFLIVDAVNALNSSYYDIVNHAKDTKYHPYVIEMDMDTTVCHRRNIHNRSLEDIEILSTRWHPTPDNITTLDPRSLLPSEDSVVILSDDDMQIESDGGNEKDNDSAVFQRRDNNRRRSKSPSRDRSYDTRDKNDSRDKNKSLDSKNGKRNTPTITVDKFSNIVMIDDLLESPGREMRPTKIVIIMRGPPGSGKSYVAKLIKDREVENGGSAPRILSIDDYFLQEVTEEVNENGRNVSKQVMKYVYDKASEASYHECLLRAFKRTVTDGYFNFIIVDAVNEQLKNYAEMWNFAKQHHFHVYISQMELDAATCHKRNIHSRSLSDIEAIVKDWYSTPSHHLSLDATTLLQRGAIHEVHMEDVEDVFSEGDMDGDNNQDEEEVDTQFTSKWDKMDETDKLARLDGTSKPLRSAHCSMEDYLQLDDWQQTTAKPGKKTVRWADIEERRKQEKMRAIGFVVGQTDWHRMTDPTQGSSALTQTKYIERVRKF